MTTGGHPPPEYAQKSLYVQQPSLRAGVFMVHQHYGTQTVNRGAVMPGVTNGAIVIHTQRLKSDPGGNLLS
ncbi:phage Kil protein [Escherichia coli]|nr:phage Kil protein [Escherichia coli]